MVAMRHIYIHQIKSVFSFLFMYGYVWSLRRFSKIKPKWLETNSIYLCIECVMSFPDALLHCRISSTIVETKNKNTKWIHNEYEYVWNSHVCIAIRYLEFYWIQFSSWKIQYFHFFQNWLLLFKSSSSHRARCSWHAAVHNYSQVSIASLR